ncbi:adenylate cyclase [Parasphingorhabdus sp.]|uniref:adenylate cyclase n=1 Tax=Parasphingorhabdus sp. TaxID=2709688 RepID=UPI002F94E06A
MATSAAQLQMTENHFYRRVALALALLIIFGFGMFSLLGLTNLRMMPTSTHLHGLIMGTWLLLFVVQNYLGTGRRLALHRKLGWFGAGLAVIAIISAWNTGIVTMALDRAPPVFTSPYFLALNLIQPIFFGGLVFAAIWMRKRTDWHRRLMLGAILIIAEPAIGRLAIIVAVPALGGPETAIPLLSTNQWIIPFLEMVAQLAILAIIMLRERAIRGKIHPAFRVILIVIPVFYAVLWSVSIVPAFMEHALALRGSAL